MHADWEEESRPTKEQVEAAARLWAHANSGSRQSRHSAAFLLSLYNGSKYPIALSTLRLLERSLYMDCVLVLAMHYYEEFFLLLGGVTEGDFEQLATRVGARTR
jgi:hypothetical protein